MKFVDTHLLGFPPYGCCVAHWGCSGSVLGRTVGIKVECYKVSRHIMARFPAIWQLWDARGLQWRRFGAHCGYQGGKL